MLIWGLNPDDKQHLEIYFYVKTFQKTQETEEKLFLSLVFIIFGHLAKYCRNIQKQYKS